MTSGFLAETLKTGQKMAEDAKAAAGKKIDEAKKTGETLKQKVSDGVEDL